MLRFVIVAGLVLTSVGVMSVVVGRKEKGLAAESSATPETITLKNLIARGADGNPNIVLTDFVPCDNYVVEEERRRWKGAWVPVVPKDQATADGRGGSPTAFKAVVFSNKSRNENDVRQRLLQAQLPGLVTNKIMSLDGKQKRLLQESYPQTDFSTCLIIHEGREPASDEKVAIMTYGGIGAAVVGLGLLGLALLLWRKSAAEEAHRTKRRKKGPLRGDEDDDEDEKPRKRRVLADDNEDDVPRRKRRPADDDEDDAPSRKRRPVARDDDEDDRPRRRPSRDDDDDDRPRRPRRRDD
jgi:hypothetical protein